MNRVLKLSLVAVVAMTFCSVAFAASAAPVPADNDDTYKLPAYVPDAAQPKGAKVQFDSKSLDNDELYVVPKKAPATKATTAKTAPAAAVPAAAAASQDPNYQQQYQQYQEQLKVYNQQMADYKKALAAQQQQQQIQQQPAPRGDNDSSYVLPGAYNSQARQAQPVQRQQQAPAAQYNQQYNYNDQNDVAKPTYKMPNYYY